MFNKLEDVKRRLKYLSKKSKFVKYSVGLAVVYSMLGATAFADDLSDLLSRHEILKRTETLQAKLDKIKKANASDLDATRLELVELMEQGDHIVKSPWESWQFGFNFMNNRFYKTPENEDIFYTRAKNPFLRVINPIKPEYKELVEQLIEESGEEVDPKTSALVDNNDPKKYYLRVPMPSEKPFGVEVVVQINPKIIRRNPISVDVPSVKFDIPEPVEIPDIQNNPNLPNATIAGFSPIQPNVVIPEVPEPPALTFLAYADCNICEQYEELKNNATFGTRYKTGYYQLHNTWKTSYEKEGLIFKYNYASSGYAPSQYNSAKDRDHVIKIDSYNPEEQITYSNGKTLGRNDMPGDERNRQYFFVGGSRGFEADSGSAELLETDTISMGGPLVFGIAKQDGSGTVANNGYITDKDENKDDYIKNMQDGLVLKGPKNQEAIALSKADTETYTINKSKDGYVGWKIGMAQIEEDSQGGKLLNEGTIDLRGESSIGQYIYLPKKIDANMEIINEATGEIFISGKNSYGMKHSAQQIEKDKATAMKFENRGNITLRKNPDGVDKADSSVGIALANDGSLYRRKVSLSEGKAKNTGTINLQDNIENSLGVYVNIATDFTNEGKINITADPEDENAKNIAMYVSSKNIDPTDLDNLKQRTNSVINAETGEIVLNGNHSMGILSDDRTQGASDQRAKGINKGTIKGGVAKDENDADAPKNDIVAMLAKMGAEIHNEGTIDFSTQTDTRPTKIIGMAISGDDKNNVEKVSLGFNTGVINVNADDSLGVYNRGKFEMKGPNASVTAEGTSTVGIYAEEPNNPDLTSKPYFYTKIKEGTITAKNSAVALYPNKTYIDLGNGDADDQTQYTTPKIIADDGGLLVYNGITAKGLPEGRIKINTDIEGEIKKGGTGFYIKGAKIGADGSPTGVNDFLDNIFVNTPTRNNNKLKIKAHDGGTILMLDRPAGGPMKLSTTKSVGSGADLTHLLGNKIEVTPFGAGNYNIYSVYRGNYVIDRDVNLDDQNDAFNKIVFRSSNLTVEDGVNIKGTKQKDGEGAVLFQSNYKEANDEGTLNDVKIINKGNITLTGDSTATDSNIAILGNYVTIENSGKLDMQGEGGIAIFSANGSKTTNKDTANIVLGEKGIGIYGANKVSTSTLGNNNIDITNEGKIEAATGKTGVYGILAKNDTTTYQGATSTIVNSGDIDFSKAKTSVAINVENSNLTNSAKIKVADKSIAIKAVNSDVTDTGEIELNGNAVAYNLGGDDLQNKTLAFNSKVKISGTGNAVFNLKDTDITNLNDNVTLDGSLEKFSYINSQNARVTQNIDREMTANSSTFISGNQSEINLDANFKFTGDKNVIIYSNGTHRANPHEVKTFAGKTLTLDGEKSSAVYAVNSNVINEANLEVGKEGAGLFLKEGETTLNNSGKITLKENAIGIYAEDIKADANTNDISLTTTGKIESTENFAKGIVVKTTSNNLENWTNGSEIDFSGKKSVGIVLDGKQNLTNSGNIKLADTTETDRNVGIYTNNNDAIINNDAKIEIGKTSIGIYGKAVNLMANSNLDVKTSGIGVYSTGGNVSLDGAITLADGAGSNEETFGLYYEGNNGNINVKNSTNLNLGATTIAVANAGEGNNITSDVANVTLKNDSLYIYSSDKTGNITSNTNVTANGDNVYAYYVGGNLTNNGNIDMSNSLGSMGIYSYYDVGGTGQTVNNGTIKVGRSDAENFIYSIGMASGYKGSSGEKSGHSINKGTIEVANEGSIGMFATGKNSKAINEGIINVSAQKGIGIYLGSGATGENKAGGEINILAGATGATGVYISKDSVFKNYGTIKIEANGAKGIYLLDGGTLVEQSEDPNIKDVELDPNAKGSVKVKKVESAVGKDKEVSGVSFNAEPPKDVTVTIDGKVVEPTYLNITDGEDPKSDVLVKEPNVNEKTIKYDDAVEKFRNFENIGSASSIGMYVDTSGVNFTKPIEGLEHLKDLGEADLIIGAEAAKYTNEKVIHIKENVLDVYNKAIVDNPQIDKWNILSGSLFWAATPNKMKSSNEIDSIVMAKVPYTADVDPSWNEYNFYDGLEKRYDKNELDSKEKDIFNKLNMIGKNEGALYRQAVHEMIGDQYATIAQRTNATGNIIDDEILYLRDEWDTESKNSNKLKVFGNAGGYISDVPGIKNWSNRAFGIAYLNEKEGVTLGNSKGWYAGLIRNDFEFRDLGKSFERNIQAKLGIYKSKSFDDNNYLNWNVAGDIFVGVNKMDRKYLVVDDIFNAKSNNYLTYGASVKNEVTKTIRLDENWRAKGYGRLDVEYGRHGNISEKEGEMRLDVASKGYFSVKPELGVMAVYNKQFHNGLEFEAKAKAAYTNELGILNSTQERAKVAFTDAGYYKLRTDKENRLGTVKLDLNVDLNNRAWGLTGNVGYDVKEKNLRFGAGLRVIY